jgi:hypothetical protein
MAEFLFAHVILAKVSTDNYVAFTCDEMSTVDNGSWISVHAYGM